ncbi:hypothetical protein ACWDA3_61510 [Nonomuraea rubra]
MALQPELATPLPLEALAQRAGTWLAAHENWLLVLDEVVDPADVAPLLDSTLAGQVLMTSRLGEGWHQLDARVLRLGVLGEQEAIELLARIATHDRPHRCQPAVMYDRVARGADGERTIARIRRLTLDRLADVPAAGPVLRVLAWYGAEPIPRALLDGLEGEHARLADVPHALGELAAYNMITLDTETVTVHRLVQAVARTPDPTDPHRQPADIDTARDQATYLLNLALPKKPEHPDGWSAWRTMLPHVVALTSHDAPADDATA